MKIKLTKALPEQLKTPPASMSGVVFGTVFSDHMFCMEWDDGKGWHSAQIKPYGPLTLEPSSMVLHYAQMSFEGLKAYKLESGEHGLFRPRENFKRMNLTSKRMCLPELDVEEMLDALKQLLRLDSGWVPGEEGTSLYIRPTILATEKAIGLKVSSKYLFYIILSPVGPYYPQGFNPVNIMVSEKYVRAVPGGVGNAKTGGNYAASILAEKEAKELGYTQVLWLDAVERRYIEEVGSMNIFFVINDTIVTPMLTGSILPGITRMSLLELGKHWGLKVEERRITIEEVLQGLKDGSVTEVFGAGTAAVVSPVGILSYKGEDCQVGNGETGPVAMQFYEHLTGIQYGHESDPFGWMEMI
ncbi:MAG: Branched-chain-amino-acid aminotransferase 2 [Deltaproteobacteria bacterium]|jgi:branched-chain amino acid aminotransferase|nr:Branched-chain-amino-acid aminotransferase 2 [Deltaproteobacteria bacterium]